MFPTSSLTQEREKSSTDELHKKICRQFFFFLRVAQVKKAKDLFSHKLHTRAHTWKPLSPPPFLPFCHSAILSAIPPFPPPQLSDFLQRLSNFSHRLSIFQEIRENLSTARSGETGSGGGRAVAVAAARQQRWQSGNGGGSAAEVTAARLRRR